jgi:prepilin signal peptidase PulO-like enzyme (type II secretory pathway)
MMHPSAELLAMFVIGVVAGAAVNWAVYALAWNRRAISPWSPADSKAPPRRLADRLPVWGWLGLRREQSLHGPRFWVRPLAVELLLGIAVAALWRWEVQKQGLVAAQFAAYFAGPLPAGAVQAPAWTTYVTFASHALLIALMAAASLIDFDEKTIPGGITTPGTLAALALAALAPMSLLPHVAMRARPAPAGVEVVRSGAQAPGELAMYIEPMTPVTPNEWPPAFKGAPEWRGLAVGLACYATWCFALAPGIWRRRRGLWFGLRVLLARALREMARPPLLGIELGGAVAIAAVWWRGGAAWIGLLSALVGMIGGSAIVWAVRVVASTALRREALGFGDVTLMMMIGAFLGWQAGVLVFFLSPFAGMVVGVLQLVFRRSDEIFYGPFLCLAAVAVIIRWGRFWNADSSIQQIFGEPWLVPIALAGVTILLGAMLVLWRNVKERLLGRGDHGAAH